MAFAHALPFRDGILCGVFLVITRYGTPAVHPQKGLVRARETSFHHPPPSPVHDMSAILC